MKEALKLVKGKGILNCLFLSDCKTLVENVIDSAAPTNSDWRAFSKILQIWKGMCENPNWACVHIPRGQNEMVDGLAKLGRQRGWDMSGHTYPIYFEI